MLLFGEGHPGFPIFFLQMTYYSFAKLLKRRCKVLRIPSSYMQTLLAKVSTLKNRLYILVVVRLVIEEKP